MLNVSVSRLIIITIPSMLDMSRAETAITVTAGSFWSLLNILHFLGMFPTFCKDDVHLFSVQEQQ